MPRGGKREGAGRPMGSRSAATKQEQERISDLAKQHSDTALKALTSIAENGVSEAARVSAANSLLDRAYGKPVQAMAHSGPGEGPIETTEVNFTPKELARRFAFIMASAAEEQRKEREQDQDVEREAS
jgi:hypothetical protein